MEGETLGRQRREALVTETGVHCACPEGPKGGWRASLREAAPLSEGGAAPKHGSNAG